MEPGDPMMSAHKSDSNTDASTARRPVILKKSPDTEKKREIALELCMHYPRKSIREIAEETNSSTGWVSEVLNEYCTQWESEDTIDPSILDELWQFLESMQSDIEEELDTAEEGSRSYDLAKGKQMMVRQFQIWLQHFDHSPGTNPTETDP